MGIFGPNREEKRRQAEQAAAAERERDAANAALSAEQDRFAEEFHQWLDRLRSIQAQTDQAALTQEALDQAGPIPMPRSVGPASSVQSYTFRAFVGSFVRTVFDRLAVITRGNERAFLESVKAYTAEALRII